MKPRLVILGLSLSLWAWSASRVLADVPPPEDEFLFELASDPARVILVGGMLALAIGSAGYFLFRRRRAPAKDKTTIASR
jgi:LPXTG-motif cell wall-anchored protein